MFHNVLAGCLPVLGVKKFYKMLIAIPTRSATFGDSELQSSLLTLFLLWGNTSLKEGSVLLHCLGLMKGSLVGK